jgi:hypothetical protein
MLHAANNITLDRAITTSAGGHVTLVAGTGGAGGGMVQGAASVGATTGDVTFGNGGIDAGGTHAGTDGAGRGVGIDGQQHHPAVGEVGQPVAAGDEPFDLEADGG